MARRRRNAAQDPHSEHEEEDADTVDEDIANEGKDEDDDDSSENEDEEHEVREDDGEEQDVCGYLCKDGKMLSSDTGLSISASSQNAHRGSYRSRSTSQRRY